MTCLRCDGLIIFETIFAENKFIDDIHCVNCGERFFKNIPLFRLDRGKKWKREGLKKPLISISCNDLQTREAIE